MNHNHLQIAIAAISVVVTIGIAYFAYGIQREAHDIQKGISALETQRAEASRRLEERRAAVSRSVALYRDFSESEAFKKLEEYRHKIQRTAWSREKSAGNEQNIKHNIAFSSKEVMTENREDILRWIAVLFQKVTLIYNCSGLKEKYEKQESAALCDPETIFILLQDPLSELFFHYRSQFYCDEYIKSQFGGEKLHTPVSRFESLMMDFLEREFRDKNWGVFRERNDYKSALKNNDIDAKSRDYSIIRYDGPCAQPT